MVDKRRIGIIGGTFNPIHLGHLMIAEVACESFNLEKVIFVPARIPPHKQYDVIDSQDVYKRQGKSTLFKLLTHEVVPDAGTVIVDDLSLIHILKQLMK